MVARSLSRRRRQSTLARKQMLFIGCCGMRIGISLAASLSLSLSVPARSEIVFVTACAIAGTLLVQGASIPLMLRALRLDRDAK
jgi:CPA1 family monovalent cation:H+ antiporter